MDKFVGTKEIANLLNLHPNSVHSTLKKFNLAYTTTAGGHKRYKLVDVAAVKKQLDCKFTTVNEINIEWKLSIKNNVTVVYYKKNLDWTLTPPIFDIIDKFPVGDTIFTITEILIPMPKKIVTSIPDMFDSEDTLLFMSSTQSVYFGNVECHRLDITPKIAYIVQPTHMKTVIHKMETTVPIEQSILGQQIVKFQQVLLGQVQIECKFSGIGTNKEIQIKENMDFFNAIKDNRSETNKDTKDGRDVMDVVHNVLSAMKTAFMGESKPIADRDLLIGNLVIKRKTN